MCIIAAVFHLALLTSDAYPISKKIDDQLLIDALKEHKIEVQSVDWNSIDALTTFDAVLVFSTWDYYKNSLQFLDNLRTIEEQGLKVYNSYDIIKWNHSKQYLNDLEKLGLKPIESIYISSNDLDELKTILVEKGWNDCVIKPQISTSGHHTSRFSLASLDDILSSYKSYDEQYIVQPFAEEVISEGEWSFVFFDKEFIHCVLKKPLEGNFLVQKGTITPVDPPEWMLQEAQHIIDTIDLPALKTRIDVIRRGNELRIMEIEMIEPGLYLKYFPGSEKKLAKILSERVCK